MGVGKDKNIPGGELAKKTTSDERGGCRNQWLREQEERIDWTHNMEELDQETIPNTKQYSHLLHAQIENTQELSQLLHGPLGYPEGRQVIHEPIGYPEGRQVIHEPTGYAEGIRVIKEAEEDPEREEKAKSQKGENDIWKPRGETHG